MELKQKGLGSSGGVAWPSETESGEVGGDEEHSSVPSSIRAKGSSVRQGCKERGGGRVPLPSCGGANWFQKRVCRRGRC